MKTCDTCKIPKAESEFNRNKAKKDGLNSICKECSRKRSRQYYKEKGEIHKKNVVKRNKKNRKVLQDYILQYFKANPCKDCGNTDPRVLKFDHLPQFKKTKDISRLLAASVSIPTLQKEMDKCEVVCANCHKIRTVERSKVNYRKDSPTITSSGIMEVKDNEHLEKLLKEMYPNQKVTRVKWTEGPTLRTIIFEE